jgi:hypothetical protein
MKRIVNGKRFDTEKAALVAEHSSPYYATDFHHYHEGLYRTAKGSWFLAGEGNAMSKYSSRCADGRGYGEGIIPLSSEEAREWLEGHGEVDAVEKHFGEEVTDA